MRIGLSLDDLIRVLDALDIGVMFCRMESSGRIVHRNAALQQILRREPVRAKLKDEMERVLEEVCGMGNRAGGSPASSRQAMERAIRTGSANYRIRGAQLGTFAEPPGVPVALVTVEPLPVDPLNGDDLRRRFRLTRREVELTYLLVRGKTNAEVAETLAISPYTAHHYTDRVLMKLGVRNRTEIGAKLLLSQK